MTLDQYINRFHLDFLLEDSVKEHIRLKKYTHGDMIITYKDPMAFVCFVVQGKVKVYMQEANGRSLLFRFQKPISLLGDAEILNDKMASAYVEALGHVEIIQVPMAIVRQYLLDQPAFLLLTIKQLSDKLYTISQASGTNLSYPVNVRYASYLLSVTDTEIKSHVQEISVSDNKVIATLLGTSYRHLNRVIKQMIDEGIIEKSGKHINVLDRDRLYMISEGSIYE